jgi:hypothetical protein
MTPILTLESVTNVHRSLFRRCNHVGIIRARLKAKVGSGIAAASSCRTELGSCSHWYIGPRRGRNPDKITCSGSRATAILSGWDAFKYPLQIHQICKLAHFARRSRVCAPVLRSGRDQSEISSFFDAASFAHSPATVGATPKAAAQ